MFGNAAARCAFLAALFVPRIFPLTVAGVPVVGYSTRERGGSMLGNAAARYAFLAAEPCALLVARDVCWCAVLLFGSDPAVPVAELRPPAAAMESLERELVRGVPAVDARREGAVAAPAESQQRSRCSCVAPQRARGCSQGLQYRGAVSRGGRAIFAGLKDRLLGSAWAAASRGCAPDTKSAAEPDWRTNACRGSRPASARARRT